MAPQNRSRGVSHTKPGAKYLAQLRKRYGKASKKLKTAILHKLVATTGYQSKYASLLLSGQRRWHDPTKQLHRMRRRFYTEQHQRTVLWLVELFDDIGSKRLRIAMNTELPNLYRQ
jgi:hypothetical protein